MEITGRLTQDAAIRTTKSNKEVVNFSIAMNHQYKKDGVRKKETTFINCAYWQSTKIAEYLTKGSIVTLSGRMSASAYIDMRGDVQPVLNFFVRDIDFISGGKKKAEAAAVPIPIATGAADDMPF